jgi:hypothetical protein
VSATYVLFLLYLGWEGVSENSCEPELLGLGQGELVAVRRSRGNCDAVLGWVHDPEKSLSSREPLIDEEGTWRTRKERPATFKSATNSLDRFAEVERSACDLHHVH